jgi:hypothetical protein
LAAEAAALEDGDEDSDAEDIKGEKQDAIDKTVRDPVAATQPQHLIDETVDEVTMPSIEVSAPVPPQPQDSAALTPAPAAMAAAAAGGAAPDGTGLQDAAANREAMLKEHKDRLARLTASAHGQGVEGGHGKEGRRLEELVADDRFIDNLADKIAVRMGASSVGPGSGMGSTMGATGMGQTGMSGTGLRFTGRPGDPTLVRPDPPSFTEPVDEHSRSELPKALRGGKPNENESRFAKEQMREPTTVTDVNKFTQEKMRGDCYVRLLINPEPNAARKDGIPYKATTLDPDATLVTSVGRPNLRIPPVKVKNEAGEDVEEDQFEDFEKSDAVVFSFVRHNRYDAVEALIQQDTQVLLAHDDNGNNLLHVACQNNNRRIAKLLLKSGIGVNDQNAVGNTPLHYCYQYTFMPLADYLVAHGANEQLPNGAGLIPEQVIGMQDSVGQAQRHVQVDRGAGA